MFKKHIELLSLKSKSNAHYIFIKYRNVFNYNKPKYKDKKTFLFELLVNNH